MKVKCRTMVQHSYQVRFIKEEQTEKLNVCKAAFTSLHCIGRGKVDDIVRCLKHSGNPIKDQRGKQSLIFSTRRSRE